MGSLKILFYNNNNLGLFEFKVYILAYDIYILGVRRVEALLSRQIIAYHYSNMIVATELGRRESLELNIASLLKRSQSIT